MDGALIRIALALLALGATAPALPIQGVCDARRNGARADGAHLDTAAIQRAIDACARAGGGVVLLDSGTFLSGTIVLRDRITLRILPGATLLASARIGDFTPYPAADVPLIAVDGSTQNKGNGPYHLIHAEGVHDVAIDGGGVIAGNGRAYWDVDDARRLVSRRPRPSPLIEAVATSGLRIENITISDAPGWTIHPLESERVLIAGVTIRNDGRGPNTDAIDVDSSRNVLIRDADIEAGDDCVVLKTTGRRGGRPVPPTRNVVVSGLICSSDDQGIKIGTESLGDMSDVLFSNIVIYQALSLYRPPTAAISLSMVDGATLERVTVRDVLIRDAATPFFLRLGNRGRGQAAPTPGVVRDVRFAGITATGGTLASSITGLPGHPVRDVSLSDIDVEMKGGEAMRPIAVPEAAGDYPHAPMFGPLPASGLYLRHVDGLSLNGVRLRTARPDARPAMVEDDVRRAPAEH